MRVITRILLGSLFLLMPHCVFAWGATEHKVVAYIAWENLDPETRRAVVELMLKAPGDSEVQRFLVAGSGDEPTRNRRFFINASLWADAVRAEGPTSLRTKYACPYWHFAEFTFGEPGVEVPDLPSFKPRQVNVLERLQFFQKALVDEDEPIGNRAIELVWTIHLVADVHNPLHIASRVTANEPGSDLGGNKFRLGQRFRSLHAYWDQILRNYYPQGESDEADHIKYVAGLVTTKFPRSKFTAALSRSKPEEWAAESFEVAQTVVYSGVTRSADPSPEYQRRAREEGELRIALAGYRLAQMLNRLFGPNRQKIASKPAMGEDTKRIKARLDYDLSCVASTLEEKTAELKVIKGTALEGQTEGGQVVGFATDDVKKIIAETKAALLATLAGEELAGLRAYAEKQFPDAGNLETINISGAPSASLISDAAPDSLTLLRTRFTYSNVPLQFRIARLPSVNNLIGSVRNLISGVRKSQPISLQVMTTPQAGANIVLQAPGGKRYATSTNSSIRDFWPGTYSFNVNKDGFVSIAHTNVDLGFGNSVIDCRLVSSGTAPYCQFR